MDLVDVGFLWGKVDIVDDFAADGTEEGVVDQARDNRVQVAVYCQDKDSEKQLMRDATYGPLFA